jgi:chloramphenicol-sensitive protein RarD
MNPGIAYAALAYTAWGMFPLYFQQVAAIPAFEVVLQRTVWSLVFMLCLLTVLKRWSWLSTTWRNPKALRLFALSALLLSSNWTLYVWAVHHHHVMDASLGYFITPLVSVVLGLVVLKERPRRVQWLAIGLAAAGVVWLTVQAGHPPWIALALAASFGMYGLLRKVAPLGALEGLTLETMLLTPIALLLMAWLHAQGQNSVAGSDIATKAWLLLSGPLTAIPLLLFAAGARRIQMATLGLLQYIAPTLQFLLGVWVFHEAVQASRLIGFAFIWAALLIYSLEGWRYGRRVAQAATASDAAAGMRTR